LDIQPAREGAVLTLADGTIIVLDSLSDGQIKTADHASVNLVDGQLSYAGTNTKEGSIEKFSQGLIQWHTLTTPRGRQFKLQLPDGSMVWLNAASSIKYPVKFSSDERR